MTDMDPFDAEIMSAVDATVAACRAEIATLRASRDAALARVAELEEAARKAAERICKSGLHVIPGVRGRCVKCQRTRNRDNQRNLTLSGGHAEKSRRYRKEHPEAVKRQREKSDPEKELARKTLRDAVRCGNVPKASACEDCGATTRLHGHHADYSKPLVVRWLCPPCHGKLHRQDALSSPPPHDGEGAFPSAPSTRSACPALRARHPPKVLNSLRLYIRDSLYLLSILLDSRSRSRRYPRYFADGRARPGVERGRRSGAHHGTGQGRAPGWGIPSEVLPRWLTQKPVGRAGQPTPHYPTPGPSEGRDGASTSAAGPLRGLPTLPRPDPGAEEQRPLKAPHPDRRWRQ